MPPVGANRTDFLNGFFSNHALFRSGDVKETVRCCSKLLGPHQMQVQGVDERLDTSFSGVVRNDFAIVRVRHGSHVTIEPDPRLESYVVQHRLQGNGQLECGKLRTATPSGAITVASPMRPTRVEMDSGSVNIVIRLPRTKLEDCVQDMLQRSIREPVMFHLCMDPGSAAATTWIQGVQHVCDQYESLRRVPNVNKNFYSVLSEYLIGLLLQIQPHNYSSVMLREQVACSPYYLKKALDFIHDNLGEAISLAVLTRHSGVSARSLQAAFKRFFGLTPMEYVRDQRIAGVHRELSSPATDTTVTGAFTKYGLYDFGRFANLYKRRYGHLPSDTLRNRK